MNLDGVTALVTGAAKRIGKAIALRLAQEGCEIALHYRTSEIEAGTTAAEIERQGGKVYLVQGDLSVREEAIEVAKKVLEWGELGVLVNSAANFPRVEFDGIEPENWKEALDVNLLGPFWLCQRIGPQLVRRGEGKIINIADVSWMSPWPTRLPYCVSKAGLVSLTVGLAKAFAPEVQVNAIGPGPILFPESYTERQRKAVIDSTLLKRQGSAEDIAETVAFFCRNDYVTGHFIPVDGGQSIPLH